MHESIVATRRDGEQILACAQCGHRFCAYQGNYRAGALLDESPVTTIPSAQDPSYYVDENMVLRRYFCPGCRVQLAAEVMRAEEPVCAEMRLA